MCFCLLKKKQQQKEDGEREREIVLHEILKKGRKREELKTVTRIKDNEK